MLLGAKALLGPGKEYPHEEDSGASKGARKDAAEYTRAGGRREGPCRTGMSVHAESRNNPNRFKEKSHA
jgi:hypothetical protein